MTKFELIDYTIIIFDQGTNELRLSNKLSYNIHNMFFMNPSGYIYSYNIIFSYLYYKYVLLIDDDRPIKKDIEKLITHQNFLEICMKIMDRRKDIYGIILKQEEDGKAECYNKCTYIVNSIKYCKVNIAYKGYYYSNGASIYKTNILKIIKIYDGEYNVANYFSHTKYRMGYLVLNKNCSSTSNACNYLIDHIGKNSSLKNKNICSLYLY